jgi:hypothetical protein
MKEKEARIAMGRLTYKVEGTSVTVVVFDGVNEDGKVEMLIEHVSTDGTVTVSQHVATWRPCDAGLARRMVDAIVREVDWMSQEPEDFEELLEAARDKANTM